MMSTNENATRLPVAMQGGVSPIQNLSNEELDRVAGGTITWACEHQGTKQQTCEAVDCD